MLDLLEASTLLAPPVCSRHAEPDPKGVHYKRDGFVYNPLTFPPAISQPSLFHAPFRPFFLSSERIFWALDIRPAGAAFLENAGWNYFVYLLKH